MQPVKPRQMIESFEASAATVYPVYISAHSEPVYPIFGLSLTRRIRNLLRRTNIFKPIGAQRTRGALRPLCHDRLAAPLLADTQGHDNDINVDIY